MSYYIRQLKAEAEATAQRHADRTNINRDAAADAARERLTPLDERVRRLLATIPASVQREGLSLPALQPMLRGRHGGTCNSGELGTALHGMGWVRTRCWRKEVGGFRALWFPPGAA